MNNATDGQINYVWFAIEGGDLVGKTTVCNYVHDVLKEFGQESVLSTGHAHGDFGQLVRSTILHPFTSESSHLSQLLLFLANRVHIYEKVVYPAISKGIIPIVDRWHMTSCAYQNQAPNIQKLCLDAVNVLPTFSIVLLANAETSLERRTKRGRATDHLEERAIANASDLNSRFLDAAESELYSEDYIVINANHDLDTVLTNVRQAVIKHLTDKGLINVNK